MMNIFTSLPKTILSGTILLLIIMGVTHSITDTIYFDYNYSIFFFRWLHVLSGVMWIGLLWYFNFVQIPNMPKIPDAQKPAIGKIIAPAALFWFRWAALATLITGLILGYLNGYIHDALTLNSSDPKSLMIGIGMWLGTIMALNVWGVIWPNQKRALGIIAKKAMMFSRINTLLSIPMLYFMVAAQNLY